MYKIPVILLNYNSSEDCEKCISFLRRQQDVEIEIVIVDNCSNDTNKINIRKISKVNGCVLIENNENRGYNAGNNIGLRYAVSQDYEFALIANPDMEFPEEDYVRAVIERIREDDDIVVCGTDIISPKGEHQNPRKRDGNGYDSFDWISEAIRNSFAKTNRKDYLLEDNHEISHYCHKISGCCFFVRLDFIESIGFFDENVFLYCEEAILARTVEAAGKKMYYFAQKFAVHNHIPSKKGNPKERNRLWLKSRNYYIDKYSGNKWFGRIIEKISNYIYLMIFTMIK